MDRRDGRLCLSSTLPRTFNGRNQESRFESDIFSCRQIG
ncbi:hypothetical protein RISK_001418 [Rhodopirellula islandica]|uniref:Uncharacterized protein n=1 Tax=Rhodopirellula islandica TaxID=595434 RepID=A0A0J1BJR0_RHOIS|nr:hypothetical protein RISK_001418 [Rhodopirellula islandica]